MASLTKSQQLVYDYLCSTMAERAVPPSVREICAATGLRSTSTVHSHLKSLEALGYITRDAGLNRSIHIVGASAAKQVPILGKVTAGLPILAVEDIEGYIPYPDKSGKELFALHVDGLSMINAGILDGDYGGHKEIHKRYEKEGKTVVQEELRGFQMRFKTTGG